MTNIIFDRAKYTRTRDKPRFMSVPRIFFRFIFADEKKFNKHERRTRAEGKIVLNSPNKMDCEEKCTGYDQVIGSNGPTSTEYNQSRHL